MGLFAKVRAEPAGSVTPAQQGVSSPPAAGSGASAGATQQALSRAARAQAVHRLQVGLFGLAGMLLLVGLANIIMDRAELTDKAAEGTQAAIAAAGPAPAETAAKDPLVDMGVAPELPVGDAIRTGPAQSAPAPAASPRTGGGN